MIKNPKVGQTVYYLHHLKPIKGVIDRIRTTYAVDVVSRYRSYLGNSEIFTSPQLAIQHALKDYNKQINELSKKREKLASRLAKILEK